MSRGKIGYIMSRFPHLPETFILREMLEMEENGWDITIYPLILQSSQGAHPQAVQMLQRVRHQRKFSLQVLIAFFYRFFQKPDRFISTGCETLWGNRTSLKFLLRACAVFPYSLYIASMMQKDGIQHIHAHYGTHPALAAWIIHRMTGIPYSVTVHAHDIYVDHSMLRTKLEEANFIVSISDFNREYLTQHFGDDLSQKIHIIRCGVFPEFYSRKSPEGNTGLFTILSIGSLQPYKGHQYLIEACARLRDRQVQFQCLIVGGGELFTRLAMQITEAGLENQVKLLGARTQDLVAEILQQADCYVQPSIVTLKGKMEGIPVSIMEAMVNELPVIATRISGIPELVIDNQTGLLVLPQDSTALADAIEVLYRNPNLRKQFGQKGCELVMEKYNLHNNVKELSQLFDQMLTVAG